MAHLEWKNAIGLVQWLRFDAVRTVEHKQASTVTKHPVQKGADIADHVKVELPRVSLTGYVSIAPLTTDAQVVRMKFVPLPSGTFQPVALPPSPAGFRPSLLQGGLLQAAVDALSSLTGPKSVESLITQAPGDRAAKAAETLLQLQEDRELVRLVDELKTYEDMVITSIVGARTAQIYGAAFQIELEQIRQVSAALVDLPVPAEPRAQLTKTSASSPKDSGQPAVDEAKRQSFLLGVKRMFSGVLGGG